MAGSDVHAASLLIHFLQVFAEFDSPHATKSRWRQAHGATTLTIKHKALKHLNAAGGKIFNSKEPQMSKNSRKSAFDDLLYVETDHVDEELGNVRNPGDTDELVASIKAHGIINPITVVESTAVPGYYHIIAGHRRFAAAKKIGLTTVPVKKIKNSDGDKLDEIAIAENIVRIDMTPYEECLAVKSIARTKASVKQIARRMGRTVRWVTVRKKLAEAGDAVLEKVKNGKIPLAQAAKLADLPDEVFKDELENTYQLDDYNVKTILERLHKDLTKAPFDYASCLQCDKCSACQTDLFDEDQKAICLDPDCWKKMVKKEASRRVEEYRANGTEATTDVEEYRENAVPAWERERIENAKKEGVAEHVYIDEDDCEETRYIDQRDLPDYHEETEEEREEREEKEAASRKFESVKEKMFRKRAEKNLEKALEQGDNEDLLAYIVAACLDPFELTTEDANRDILEMKEPEYGGAAAEDLPESKGIEDIVKAVRASIPSFTNNIYSMDKLKALYRIFVGKDIEKLTPTDKEVQEEIDRQEAEKKTEEE